MQLPSLLSVWHHAAAQHRHCPPAAANSRQQHTTHVADASVSRCILPVKPLEKEGLLRSYMPSYGLLIWCQVHTAIRWVAVWHCTRKHAKDTMHSKQGSWCGGCVPSQYQDTLCVCPCGSRPSCSAVTHQHVAHHGATHKAVAHRHLHE